MIQPTELGRRAFLLAHSLLLAATPVLAQDADRDGDRVVGDNPCTGGADDLPQTEEDARTNETSLPWRSDRCIAHT
jgi:hypothetical protein